MLVLVFVLVVVLVIGITVGLTVAVDDGVDGLVSVSPADGVPGVSGTVELFGVLGELCEALAEELDSLDVVVILK